MFFIEKDSQDQDNIPESDNEYKVNPTSKVAYLY